jgi:hypothetical protein
MCFLGISGCVTIEKLSGSTLIQKSDLVETGVQYLIFEPEYASSESRTEYQAYSSREKPVLVKTGREAYGQTHDYMNRAIREEFSRFDMMENRERYSLIVKYQMDYDSIDYYGEKKTNVMVNIRVYDSESNETYYFRNGSFLINERLDLRGSRIIVADLLSDFLPNL